MKKGKMALLALVGLMGVTSAIAGKHKALSGRDYGITGKTPLGNDWTVELLTGICTNQPATQCGVNFDDGGVTLSTIPVGAGTAIQPNKKYQH